MSDLKITKNTFDLKKVFRDKGSGIHKWIPGFVWAYLNRKLHVGDLNEFMFKNKDKMGLDFVRAGIERLGVKYEIIGIENLNQEGKLTLAANHPLGGPEGLALMQIVGDQKKEFTFLSNDILMSVPNLKMLFTPVNKHGSNADYFELFNESFSSDKMVVIFPAGMVSRRQNGEIRDLLWRSSFITRSVKNKRFIIPVHIGGKNSNWFYFLGVFRTKLKLKANLEMFLLPDEMFKQKDKTIKFTIGKPIDSAILDERFNHREWSGIVKDYVYKLKDNPDLLFDEKYVASVLK